MNFRPLHDRVLVQPLDGEEKTAGGIIIPDTAKEKPSEGKIKKIHIQEVNNRKFFLMTGVGYDASVVETVQSNLFLKKIFGKLFFFIISIAKLIYFKKYELKILANNKVYYQNLSYLGRL